MTLTRRPIRQRQLLGLAIVLTVSACDVDPATLSEPTLGPRAELFLDKALDVMEFNSIKRYEIDWPAFREIARSEAEVAGAQVPFDTYPTIVAALERIGDNHSFFRGAGGQQLAPGEHGDAGELGPGAVDPMSELLETGIAYIDVPAFDGGGAEGNDLAAAYHGLIEAVDTLGPVCRWVVDLRGNTGGNMWPMVAGIGPILGEGTPGFFVDPDTVISPWFYEAGAAGVDSMVVAFADPPYTLVSQLPWVAVLTDSLTASSGEAVAVAFRARDGARSFGGSTWGVSTANAAFPLDDGAVIFLTVATMADREGTLYGQELIPDELVVGTKTGDRVTDAALDAAMVWLLAQSCA
jgi:Peptidase family S41